MNKLAIGLVSVLLSINVFAQESSSSVGAFSGNNESIFVKKQKIDREGIELYATNWDMKSLKKVGLGLALGGSNGVIGLNGEVNLDPAEALVVGLGLGPSYGTFGLGWKHNFEGEYLSPYSKVGYSKWFSSSSGSGSAADSDVLKRLFSESDLRSNRFDADFITGGGGIEYNQLEGELAGINFYGEVILMAEVRSFTFIPTGAVGITYYY